MTAADRVLKFCIGLAFVAGLFLFVLYGVVAYGDGQHTANKFDPLAALVQLEGNSSKCSGAHIGHGYVLTAAHCSDLSIVDNRHEKLPTEVAFEDKERDVAVLYADAISVSPSVRVSCALPKRGEHIVAAGHPGPFSFMQFAGVVASRMFPLNFPNLKITSVIGIDVTGMGGMSGGPVYIGDRVAAVFVAGPQYALPTRGLFFATPLSVVCNKLPVPLT